MPSWKGFEPHHYFHITTELPMVEVWLGLLQGQQYELKQCGDFYDPTGIWIAPGNLARFDNPL